MVDESNNKNIDIEIIYKSNKNNEEKIRIFGKKFVNNNKKKCKIVYKCQEYELKEYFEDIVTNYNYKGDIILTLRIIKTITDISFMFSECISLYSFPGEPQFNSSKITNMSDENIESESFLSFLDEHKNISNADEMSNMIDEINKTQLQIFSSKSAISKKTSTNNSNISDIFPKGNALSTLINSKVINMMYMFYKCNSLESLPDLSKWDTSNINNMSYLFYECNSLESLHG